MNDLLLEQLYGHLKALAKPYFHSSQFTHRAPQQGSQSPNIFSGSELMESHSLQSAACVIKARIGQPGGLPQCLAKRARLHVGERLCIMKPCAYVYVRMGVCTRGCVFISECVCVCAGV